MIEDCRAFRLHGILTEIKFSDVLYITPSVRTFSIPNIYNFTMSQYSDTIILQTEEMFPHSLLFFLTALISTTLIDIS